MHITLIGNLLSGWVGSRSVRSLDRKTLVAKGHRAGVLVALLMVSVVTAPVSFAQSQEASQLKFKRVPTQFIAALGDPKATSGSGAESWGIWTKDPGPRGVWFSEYDKIVAAGGVAPSNWQFTADDWWLEENGILMEQPEFPMPAGKFVVTGDRETVTILTVYPADNAGNQRWELAGDATLYDVTHLPCRSARYTPISENMSCLPPNANKSEFPVTPGAVMPSVKGCLKQDYAVLFIIGVAVES